MTFFNRSIYIIIYLVAVSTFTCLAFSSILTSYENTKNLQNGLSENSIQVSIQSNMGETNLTNNDMLDKLVNASDSFLLYKELGTYYGKEIYLHNTIFPFETASNRKDINFFIDSIIIDQALLNNTITKNDTQYFLFKGKYYEVIDSFIKVKKDINQDSSFFTALNIQDSLIGNYVIDGIPKQTLENILNEFVATFNGDLTYSIDSLSLNFKDRISLVFKDQILIIFILLLTILLIVMNTIGTIIAWIDSRKDEIKTRYLVGASSFQIQFWLLKEYWLILISSFLIGTIAAIIVFNFGFLNYLIKEVNIYGIFISLCFCFFIGTLTAIISITYHYTKKSSIRKDVKQ
ncbi:FtsX-like permease family protein [Lysinibacillus sp. NPDC048646]|uniref:FtsX-like permease family protein n=1 Tax=Lysinibacillus sp. NPDC048646 TaxID=3390574 RepID=UPI003D012228